MRQPKIILHVNRHNISRNDKTGSRDPVFTVKRARSNTYCDLVEFHDANGKVVGRLRYEPDHPLSCGAKCWIEWYGGKETVKLHVGAKAANGAFVLAPTQFARPRSGSATKRAAVCRQV